MTFNYSNIEALDKINIDGLHIDHFPLFFDQTTSNYITKQLEELAPEYFPTFYREDTTDKKIQICTKGAAWFVDYNAHISAKDWTYTICKDHINGIPARPLYGFLESLRDLVSSFTKKDYNSVLVRRFKHGEDYTMWNSNQDPWLGDEFDTPCFSFGTPRKLDVRKKLEYIPPRLLEADTAMERDAKKQTKIENQRATVRSFSLYNGSLIIMKQPTQKLWQHRIASDDDILETSYHLIFRNLKPEIIHKQYQKYPLLSDRRTPEQLEKQWMIDQKITARIEKQIDQEMFEKTEPGFAQKLSKQETMKLAREASKQAKRIAEQYEAQARAAKRHEMARKKQLELEERREERREELEERREELEERREELQSELEHKEEINEFNEKTEDVKPGFFDNVRDWLSGPVSIKPVEDLFKPKRHIIGLEEQKEMLASDLERKIKEETGNDIHIKTRQSEAQRFSEPIRRKGKTVIVDLQNEPTTPETKNYIGVNDQKSAINRSYNRLLKVKEIDPELFDKHMRSISNTIKRTKTIEELTGVETELLQNVPKFEQDALENLKNQGVISDREAQEWN